MSIIPHDYISTAYIAEEKESQEIIRKAFRQQAQRKTEMIGRSKEAIT